MQQRFVMSITLSKLDSLIVLTFLTSSCRAIDMGKKKNENEA